MNTLTISHLFSNLQAYQDQYLSIVNDPAQYYTPVENAYVKIWPAAKQPLYLGDLLQLWLAEKWIINAEKEPLINTILREKTQANPQLNQYVYAIEGNLLTGKNSAQAWSADLADKATLNVSALFQFYCVWKSLNRPQIQHKNYQQVV
ncbi:hypothetical protein [Acinetobacter sp. ANC 3813]|uniref:hypothetical protein n=1 Tax=Acinetobacter sp. ANC 3813 TaxID=1977873 RepID=UPI000A351354|nr:hypothetical protein [Acinetobacter sp. ANC 3813]OTG91951.1 hypothetical protein B9T34_00965 [Acinetobacter sp. ANC 3813]